MVTIFKCDFKNGCLKKQEVEKAGFPNLDADGETQYDNTHFQDESDAWARLVAEFQAALSVNTKNVVSARNELALREKFLADDAIILERVRQAYGDYLLSFSVV